MVEESKDLKPLNALNYRAAAGIISVLNCRACGASCWEKELKNYQNPAATIERLDCVHVIVHIIYVKKTNFLEGTRPWP